MTISDRKLSSAPVKPASPSEFLHRQDSIANIPFLNLADNYRASAHTQTMAFNKNLFAGRFRNSNSPSPDLHLRPEYSLFICLNGPISTLNSKKGALRL